MEIRDASLHGVKVFHPEVRPDERGFFLRVFDAQLYADAGIDHTGLVQENQSRSRQRTIRGLHARSNLTEAKLVRCIRGEVFDVVVDLRPWSPTFLEWENFTLDDVTHAQIYIPPGCAHGLQALSDMADVGYRVDAYYDPSFDVAISYADPDLAIPWPLDDPVVSERDRAAPKLTEVRDHLTDWYGSEPPT